MLPPALLPHQFEYRVKVIIGLLLHLLNLLGKVIEKTAGNVIFQFQQRAGNKLVKTVLLGLYLRVVLEIDFAQLMTLDHEVSSNLTDSVVRMRKQPPLEKILRELDD